MLHMKRRLYFVDETSNEVKLAEYFRKPFAV